MIGEQWAVVEERAEAEDKSVMPMWAAVALAQAIQEWVERMENEEAVSQ